MSKITPKNNKKHFRYEVTVGKQKYASILHCAEHYGFNPDLLYRKSRIWRKLYNIVSDTPSKTFKLNYTVKTSTGTNDVELKVKLTILNVEYPK